MFLTDVCPSFYSAFSPNANLCPTIIIKFYSANLFFFFKQKIVQNITVRYPHNITFVISSIILHDSYKTQWYSGIFY